MTRHFANNHSLTRLWVDLRITLQLNTQESQRLRQRASFSTIIHAFHLFHLRQFNQIKLLRLTRTLTLSYSGRSTSSILNQISALLSTNVLMSQEMMVFQSNFHAQTSYLMNSLMTKHLMENFKLRFLLNGTCLVIQILSILPEPTRLRLKDTQSILNST